MNAHHKKITRAMKQTKKGGSHLLSKKVAESFVSYGESQGWKIETTPVGPMFRACRAR